MSGLITVVGATGHVGHELAERLLSEGTKVRAIARSADRLRVLVDKGAEAQVGSVEDPKFTSAAFRGADGVFVMLPPDYGHPDPLTRAHQLTDAIAAGLQVARVRYAVTLSSLGAERPEGTGPVRALHHLERRVNQIPSVNVVHLRPAYFFENYLSSIGLIRNAGILGGAFLPDLPMAMIASRDIAAVAAQLLGARSFTGQAVHELPGPKEYSQQEVAGILGDSIGRPDLRYVQFPDADFAQALTGVGFSSAAAQLFVELAHGVNQGLIAARTRRTAENTAPTRLEDFAQRVFAPAFNG